ncbi:tyrosine-type recombinase/integrase [Actinoplanes sp. TFC3]|uniref:tyrosine-type recombinase/integrase n=1 Tax=Actinoplanes sp. TFC3 TaxID=1710355 RepID=UPI00082E325C|nr:tyrosine-type recombinase/integrase [Actinoplanes sp. TFC3]
MSGRPVLDDLRVQEVRRPSGQRSFTIVWPEGVVHRPAASFLAGFDGSGTQRTYAYLLVDHLRWLEREALRLESVTIADLKRYMAAIGARFAGPFGEPWRVKPLGQSALGTAASCLKGFYLHQCDHGVNVQLGVQLRVSRLPSRADRERALLGHLHQSMPANPLAPRRVRRRHPKLLPEGAKELLLAVAATARDRMVMTWLADGGYRIGELCGLHLSDLHLRDGASCGECAAPHSHVCHRGDNPNQAEAKTKRPWVLDEDTVRGGLIKRVSPAMIHTYFDYMRSEYPPGTEHGMLLVQLAGDRAGQPWATVAARRMLERAGHRAGLGKVLPHAFRHSFATAVLEASGGDLLIARDAGGWASASVVDEIYAHVDITNPAFGAALRAVWGEQA